MTNEMIHLKVSCPSEPFNTNATSIDTLLPGVPRVGDLLTIMVEHLPIGCKVVDVEWRANREHVYIFVRRLNRSGD